MNGSLQDPVVGMPLRDLCTGMLRKVRVIVPYVVIVLAILAIRSAFKEYSYSEMVSALKLLSESQVAIALLLCALNYLLLTFYDFLGLRVIGKTLRVVEVVMASLSSYAVSHTVGFSLLSSAAVRYRFYSRAGLTSGEVGAIVVCASTFLWLGFVLLLASCAVCTPESFAVLGMPPLTAHILGFATILGVLTLILLPAEIKSRIVGTRLTEVLPNSKLALLGTGLGAVDWFLAAAVLYVMLPAGSGLTLGRVVAVYQVAQAAAIVSSVPGGVGVFEAIVTLLLSSDANAPTIFGALVAYRCVYYFIPFLCGISALGISELKTLPVTSSLVPTWLVVLARQSASVVPVLLSGAVFLCGAILLLSGALPTAGDRLWWVEDVLPLSVVEGSHFLASVVGTLLLVLAISIRKRLARAWGLTLVLLITGAIATFLKGFDYEESAFALFVAAALVLARKTFSRRAVLDVPLRVGHILAIAVALATTAWLGFFSYENVAYSHRLWWEFAADADAPRFLRASVISAVIGTVLALRSWLHAKPPRPLLPTPFELQQIAECVRASADTEANLALLGDKYLLRDDTGASFLMYGISGRSWIAMGDPVAGDASVREELIWRFRELCDLHGAYPAFYEIGTENLPLYVDAGFELVKIGEQALVSLADFNLEGSQRKSLRQGVRRIEREGYACSIIPRSEVPAHMATLREISSEWLGEKKTREKGFSLGFFDERYLAHFDIVTVTHNERVVAFANLWCSGTKEELSVDLMRFRPGTHNGIMDLLFVYLLTWGREQGYQHFNLGMAPLSGLSARPLASRWSKVGAYLFRHGEHFYNFQGLREYKDKFNPEWAPRYIATQGGWALPLTMANLASLISGGLRGVIGK